MNQYNSNPAAKKVKYIASVIYIIVLTFLVGGSYLHQQQKNSNATETEEGVIWSEPN